MFGIELVQTDTELKVNPPPSKILNCKNLHLFSFLKVGFSSVPALLPTSPLSEAERHMCT